MIVQVIIIVALLIIPAGAGFAVPFFRRSKQTQRLICIFSLGWMPLIIIGLQIYGGRGLSLSDAVVLLAALLFAVVLFYIGLSIGRPFASIWIERKNNSLGRTFE